MSKTIATEFKVKDDANPGNSLYYILQRSPYGLWVSVYKEKPEYDTPDLDA